MSKRKNVIHSPREKAGTRPPSSDVLNVENFPFLAEFVRGYLHQDAVPEHRDALGAAKAYLADLGASDRAALSKEAQAIKQALKGRPITAVNTALGKLGSHWTCNSTAEFETMLDLLSAPSRPLR